ncbi:MAG: protein translocase subunit SecF [Sphaerochaetaceae bacterium]
MAKKIYPITKFRFVAVAVSALFLIAAVAAYIIFGGFNLSIDFQSGFSQRVQIATSAISFSYEGSDSVTLNISGSTVTLVKRDLSGTKYHEFSSANYPTIGQLANAINKEVEGVKAVAIDESAPTNDLITGFGLPATLKAEAYILKSANPATANYITIDEVRQVLGGEAQVQIVGEAYRQIFQFRLSNDDNLSESEMSNYVLSSLEKAFGEDSVVVLQSDFVGPKYSSSLVSGSILIVVIAIALILLYIWFRFKLSYALAAIITLVHDTLFLIGFIVLFRLEVSTTTIAAILTIIGYSLNNVIVIFDRVRENRPILKKVKMREIIDISVSQSLTRTIHSSLTTAIAILPLAFFAGGAIQLFAIKMVFGIVVGAYSCNFLAPALLMWITKSKNEPIIKKVEAEVKELPVTEEEDKKEEVVTDVPIPTIERKLKGKRQQKK